MLACVAFVFPIHEYNGVSYGAIFVIMSLTSSLFPTAAYVLLAILNHLHLVLYLYVY